MNSWGRERNMTLTEKIKLKALDLGFVKVGITTADDFHDYIDKLMSRKNYEFLIDKGEKSSIIMGSKPKSVAKEAKSIISIIYSYSHIDFPEKLIDKVGRAYQTRCYIPKADNINGARLHS